MSSGKSQPDLSETIGRRLRDLRRHGLRRFSQAELGEAMREMGTSWSQKVASLAERNERELTLNEAARLAVLLGVPLDELVSLSCSPRPTGAYGGVEWEQDFAVGVALSGIKGQVDAADPEVRRKALIAFGMSEERAKALTKPEEEIEPPPIDPEAATAQQAARDERLAEAVRREGEELFRLLSESEQPDPRDPATWTIAGRPLTEAERAVVADASDEARKLAEKKMRGRGRQGAIRAEQDQMKAEQHARQTTKEGRR